MTTTYLDRLRSIGACSDARDWCEREHPTSVDVLAMRDRAQEIWRAAGLAACAAAYAADAADWRAMQAVMIRALVPADEVERMLMMEVR